MVAKRRQRARRERQRQQAKPPNYRWRRLLLLGLLSLAGLSLVGGAIYRSLIEAEFLSREGYRRHVRQQEIPAHRGLITDRWGEPLAVSAPVDTVVVNPRRLFGADDAAEQGKEAGKEKRNIKTEAEAPPRDAISDRDGISRLKSFVYRLARVLERDPAELWGQLKGHRERSFFYLKRRVNPEVAARVKALAFEAQVTGIDLVTEYRRFYPGGEVFAHVVGLTDVDDQGQEGIEYVFNNSLRGTPGRKQVVKDGLANAIDVESLQEPKDGADVALSIDRRLQYLAYRELKNAVREHGAQAASAVILDARTGEVLALVNQPAFNPNGERAAMKEGLRNRAVVDQFEPGSTMKPFPVALALELGTATPNRMIDTRPGSMQVGRHQVRDIHNYGVIDVSTVIRKSSNVGVAELALELSPERMWRFYADLGFGTKPGTGFVGEREGYLPHFSTWSKITQATLSFGYGVAVSPLQLARAYAVIAADGVRRPVSLIRLEQPPAGERVLSVAASRSILHMMEEVVTPEGTAPKAAIPGYRVAGKTGTVRKHQAGGYSAGRYLSVFAGIAPASDPRLVMVVMVDEPSTGVYYGGLVAAPVFGRVMASALRMLNVPPDRIEDGAVHLASAGGAR